MTIMSDMLCKGLRNLRRSVPLIVAWDDHDIADNDAKTGAYNHDPDTQGPWAQRVAAAKQAYVEWMPLRVAPGEVNGLPTQRFEFGDLMTLVLPDWRIQARSVEPSLLTQDLSAIPLAYAQAGCTIKNLDVSTYAADPCIIAVSNNLKDIQEDPTYEMYGNEQISFVADAFEQSVMNGKTWQVLGDGGMMAEHRLPCVGDFSKQFPEDPLAAAIVKGVTDAFLSGEVGLAPGLNLVALGLCAMQATNVAYNYDSWSGCK